MPHRLEIAQHDFRGPLRCRDQPPSAPFTAMARGKAHIAHIRERLHKGIVGLARDCLVDVDNQRTA